MNKPLVLGLLFFSGLFGLKAQCVETREAGEARSYTELIEQYQCLAQSYSNAILLEAGPSDCGRPLHLFIMQAEAFTTEQGLQEIGQGQVKVLVNNGIHPGESCGMDASLEWSSEVLAAGGPPDGQCWAMIPVYNIGGSLKRRPHTRANQVGPHLQGFRGNAGNYDLNRDFVKADALNTKSFFAIYQAFRPHIFIDTHTSNGADYPYTMTLISTLSDKLAPSLQHVLKQELEPFLYKQMKERNWEMIPYVNVFGRTPNDGYAAFLETPRYASGYTALFHSLGFISEAHMFKAYDDRVAATRAFLSSMQAFCKNQGTSILSAYKEALKWEQETNSFPVAWELDSNRRVDLSFKAYPYNYEKSALGEYERLRYIRGEAKELKIDYYPHYKATESAQLPKYYVIPQACRAVIERLQYHNIKLEILPKDTLMAVQSIYLEDWGHADRPYEGHFRTEVKSVRSVSQQRLFYAGDYLVSSQQDNRYFLASVLEPRSIDSYLSWGFFNIIFQQKEYFSPYVFEDKALEMLAADPKLAQDFEQWKTEHPEALNEAYAILSFFYQRSAYYEPEHLRYPIAFIYR